MQHTLSSSLSVSVCAAALRFCRRIVGLKDDFYNRYLVYRNLLSPIVKAFMANGHRYNLVDSAILELFDFIRLVRGSSGLQINSVLSNSRVSHLMAIGNGH